MATRGETIRPTSRPTTLELVAGHGLRSRPVVIAVGKREEEDLRAKIKRAIGV